jgi:mRNA-degrading endonuclease RelE of RelBE toxin-antitoxin system
VYEIRWGDEARDDMRRMRLRDYEARQIIDAVDEHLTREPGRSSKRKKTIRPGERLPFEHLEPVWQLRVGQYRVFYDVTACERESAQAGRELYEGVVSIRAVRYKPGHQTTRNIL